MPAREPDAPVDPFMERVLARHAREEGMLVQILREAQVLDGWLPPATISYLAARLGLPRARVEGVASFYSFLHLVPVGRYRVLFSDNVTDRMAGSEELLNRLCTSLWVERGKTSEDALVSVDTTSCTGMCDQAPALLVNNHAIPNLTSERIDQIAELIRAQVALDDWPRDLFEVTDNVYREDMLLGTRFLPGEALRAAIARGQAGMHGHTPEGRSSVDSMQAQLHGPALTLEELKRSNLRGRGGAGFNTGLKWEACRSAPGDRHYVVCNADEGEPGTFKDRVLLARHADLVFEGMTLCAYVIGATAGLRLPAR